jgi:hypothetical protein
MLGHEFSPFTIDTKAVVQNVKSLFNSLYLDIHLGNGKPKAVSVSRSSRHIPKLADILRENTEVLAIIDKLGEDGTSDQRQGMRILNAPEENYRVNAKGH